MVSRKVFPVSLPGQRSGGRHLSCPTSATVVNMEWHQCPRKPLFETGARKYPADRDLERQGRARHAGSVSGENLGRADLLPVDGR